MRDSGSGFELRDLRFEMRGPRAEIGKTKLVFYMKGV